MKLCPKCSASLDDAAQFCKICGATLTGVPYAPAPGYAPQQFSGEVPTSGKAIASLVCGCLCFFFPASIVAVVMGHISLSEIQKSAGRLKGKGMATAGLVLGYMGVSIIPILIIAAIAIPNLLKSRLAANEASAVGALRTVNTACVTYSTTYNTFPPSLASLGPGGQPGADAANLIDLRLASGLSSGYVFAYVASPALSFPKTTYYLTADPLAPGTSGIRHFFTDQTGVIRVSVRGPANRSSPPLM